MNSGCLVLGSCNCGKVPPPQTTDCWQTNSIATAQLHHGRDHCCRQPPRISPTIHCTAWWWSWWPESPHICGCLCTLQLRLLWLCSSKGQGIPLPPTTNPSFFLSLSFLSSFVSAHYLSSSCLVLFQPPNTVFKEVPSFWVSLLLFICWPCSVHHCNHSLPLHGYLFSLIGWYVVCLCSCYCLWIVLFFSVLCEHQSNHASQWC